MKPICIKDTEDSPAIFMDLNSGRLIITGISVMADPRITYHRLLQIIRKYAGAPAKKSHVSILLQETNTQSLLFLLEALRLLKNTNVNQEINIDWLYDSTDDDLSEQIDIFMEILNITINKIAFVKMNWAYSRNVKKTMKAFSFYN